MKLYAYFRSQASFRVRIALSMKGLAQEDVLRHLEKGAAARSLMASSASAEELRRQTGAIPIVFAHVADPICKGSLLATADEVIE